MARRGLCMRPTVWRILRYDARADGTRLRLLYRFASAEQAYSIRNAGSRWPC